MHTPSRSLDTQSVRQDRRHIDYRPNGMVEIAIARRLGVKDTTAHGLMHGRESVFARAAAICEELIRYGRRPKADELCRVLFRVMSSAPRAVLCDALVVREAEADAKVTAARSAYQASHAVDDLASFEKAVRAHEVIARELSCAAVAALETA
jgi:hypothetical protein